MSLSSDKHVETNGDSVVEVIDLDTYIEEIIVGVTEKPENMPPVKIQIDPVSSTDTMINGNGNIINSESKPSIAEVVQKARNAYNRGITRSMEWRRKQLKSLCRMYEEKYDSMVEALYKDLKKSKLESVLLECDYLHNELKNIYYNLDNWCKPQRPGKDIMNILDDVLIYNDPYGVVLIIGAWNYPFQLLLLPLTGAIAAGNAVILKPSEITVACNKFFTENIPKYLDTEAIFLIEGGPQETTELLKQKFDHIFYTGSTNIGRIIYEAAAKNLTPVTLELGGKCPVYVDNTVDITVTAKRILWGKLVNGGQICVAPDFMLCSKETQDKFVEVSKKILKEWLGENAQKSPDYCRIINSKHFSHLQSLIDVCKDKIVVGGGYDLNDLYIEPTLMANVTAEDKIMEIEIFGPILPIVPIKNAQEAINIINNRERPLVLYVFSNKDSVVSLFANNTNSGGMHVNNTLVHMAVRSLPFGGIGASGMGSYHGKSTLDTFTHKKGCLKQGFFCIAEKIASARYPPYTDRNLKFLTLLTHKWNLPSFKFVPYLLAFIVGVGVSYGISSWQKAESEEF